MTATIVRIASRGEGVTDDGRHVPLAAPGDAIADDGVVTPGPHAQVPPCRHYPECGGCQLQHVDDAAYAGFVVERIASALRAQGIAGAEILTPHLSPPRSRRRATLHSAHARGQGAIGFNAARSHDIVDMRECHILRPELFALVAPLRALTSRLGKARTQAGVSMTLVDQGVDVTLTGIETRGLAASDALNAFAARPGVARVVTDFGYGPETWAEPQPATVTLGGVPVPFPPGGFVQATADGEAVLISAVNDVMHGTDGVADLFAGLGTFALSNRACAYAAEGTRDVALALTAAANRAQRRIAVEHRDLFRRPLIAAELKRFGAIVLDPPRAGAKEQCAHLAASGVPRIAYASCNPATFARDARTLCDGGYALDWVKPVGQFRWSTHVELVGAFRRV